MIFLHSEFYRSVQFRGKDTLRICKTNWTPAFCLNLDRDVSEEIELISDERNGGSCKGVKWRQMTGKIKGDEFESAWRCAEP